MSTIKPDCHMRANRSCSGIVLMSLCSLCICFSGLNSTLAQEPNDLQAALAAQLEHEIGNPPERGDVSSLSAVKAVEGLALPAVTFNRYLSLLITDVDTVNQFRFSELMDHFVAETNDDGFSRDMLFHQWWDTQNQRPGLAMGPHCDDVPPQDKLNQFKYDCPRYEGSGTPANRPTNTPPQPAQATSSSVFADEAATPGTDSYRDAYSAIAISNRFDLFSAPRPAAKGKITYPDCGEYRIIFARNSGKTIAASQSPDGKEHDGDIRSRILISFEFRLKNPDTAPENAADTFPNGCVPILRFFYSLSQAATGAARGKLLHDFFMTGLMKGPDGAIIGQLPGKWGVANLRNIALDSGQIRTDQFLNLVKDQPAVPPPNDYSSGTPAVFDHSPNNWILREFRAFIVGENSLTVRIVPVTTKSTPDIYLFNPSVGSAEPRLKTLIANIEDQYANLLGGNNFGSLGDINAISYKLSGSVTNGYQSVTGSPQPCGPPSPSACNKTPDDIVAAIAAATPQPPLPPPNLSFLVTDIQDFLNLPSSKTPPGISAGNIIDRLRTQTCAGCHQFSDTKYKSFGYDSSTGLGGGAVWPIKACGDYAPTCTLPAFIIQDKTKLHPPMQFTQIAEDVLIPSAADADGKHWRYAISSTAECFLDFREALMAKLLNFAKTTSCPKIPQ